MLALPLSNSSSQVELHLGIATRHLAAAAAAAAIGFEAGDVSSLVLLPQLLQQRPVVSDPGMLQNMRMIAACGQPREQQQQQMLSREQASAPLSNSTDVAAPNSASSKVNSHIQQQQQQVQQQLSGLKLSHASAAAAAAAAAQHNWHHTANPSSSSSSNSSNSSGVARALQAVQSGVVLIRVGRSWGSGVLMTASGLVLTNAHLFKDANNSNSSSRRAGEQGRWPKLQNNGSSADADMQQQQQQQSCLWRGEAVYVRLAPQPDSSSSSSWIPARLLYRFQGYLDIAVLQLQLPGTHTSSSSRVFRQQQQQLQPLQLCAADEEAAPGSDVFVIGHGLFGPGLHWPPPVTSGCAARVVTLLRNIVTRSSSNELRRHPAASLQDSSSSSKPSMLVTTAAVHGGASGGACVNAQGKLVGLVTSNARHARGATLPHCNFCIAAAELRPLWAWAQRMQQQQQVMHNAPLADSNAAAVTNSSSGSSTAAAAAAAAMLQELQALDLRNAAGSRLWALQQPLPLLPAAPGDGSSSSSGGAAAAVERLGRKLRGVSTPHSKL
jgi:S1-C subfamily serine protease